MINDRSSPLALLLSRRSAKARDLVAPGPDPATLDEILAAAARVPDHGKLAPWRFVVIADRDAFAQTLLAHYTADKPEAGRLERDAMEAFARQAPTLVAVVSLVKDCHIPAWEQQLSAGAAAFALHAAATAAGFGACWLTGPAAYLPGMADALGVPGGRIAGFLFLGTPSKALEERPRPVLAEVVIRFPSGSA
jgi:nitroreductase